jgi:peptide-methionine (S)-S-oxide reductase
LFRKVKGVTSAQVGYTGGNTKNPTYEDVCSGTSGHAEAIEIEYDPSIVSYSDLLMIFWSNHNPTTPNQQGPDIGEQYRSVVFYHNKEQENTAKTLKDKLQVPAKERFGNDIVTEIIPASIFYRAEEYHQQYLVKNSDRVCHTELN